MVNSRWVALAVVVVTVGFLSGCGSSSSSDGTAPGGTVGLTPANAPLAASAGAGAIFTMSDISDFSEELFFGWLDGMMAARTAERVAAAPVPVMGACESGTLTADFTDVGDEGLSSGDSVVFAFAACEIPNDGGGSEFFSGTIDLDVNTRTGGPAPPFTLVLLYTFGPSFTVTDGMAVTELTGGFTYTYTSQDGIELHVTFAGSSLAFDETEQGETYSATLTNFSQTIVSYNFSPTRSLGAMASDGDYSIDSIGTVADSELGGSVSFETTTPLAGTDPNYPDEGVLVISAAGGTITLTPQADAINVLAELDADGDGTPEDSEMVLWDDLY